MPAITQQVSNFLGGVSKQIDSKKLPGQVTDAINAYPDPTFGMLKRNGQRFIRTINNAQGVPHTDLADAAWFFIQRGADDAYFGCVKDKTIRVWNTITGQPCAVVNPNSEYLDITSPDDLHFRTVQDVTIITNKKVLPELEPEPTGFQKGLVGTVVIKVVEYSAEYSVKINDTVCTYTTRNADVFDENGTDIKLNSEEIIEGIADAIEDEFRATMTVTRFPNSLEIVSSQPFELSCKGGITGQAIICYQDEVDNVSQLSIESYEGRTVKILNAAGEEDDYYRTFKNGIWVESRSPEVSEGFKNSTMPHELVNIGSDAFEFQPIEWTKRLVGDDTTNPPPSIFRFNETTNRYQSPGHPIQATFFYNNRLGLLSRDNVIMSQVNDPYNLFKASARTTVVSDPVDVSSNSVRPVTLFDVLPSAEGLLLFAKREQFVMFASDSGPITPLTVVIRGISNYDSDDTIAPVDNGTTSAFVSKVPGYSKLMTMQTQGTENPPIVLDISKVVTEWLPSNVTDLISSAQSSFLALTSRDTNNLYMYKYFNNGKEDLFQSWVRWELTGHIQASFVVDDLFYFVTEQSNQYVLSVISVNDIPVGIQMASNVIASPFLDMYTRPTVEYNVNTGKTKLSVPYNHLEGRTPIMLLTMPSNGRSAIPRTLQDLIGTFNVIPADAETDAVE